MSKDKIHVLLIEDDPDDHVLTRALLGEMEGYEVTLDWASDYQAGQRKTKQGDYDVILVDYRLGQYSGLDILQSAKNQCSAPIIFLTGQEDHEVDVAATKAGAADYLVKRHINAPLLERSIRYSMQHKRVESAWRSALQENNRLATAVTNLPIGVIITDPLQNDHPVIFVNPAFTEITGYSMMEATGKNCRFLQGQETNRETVDQMRFSIAQAQPFQNRILNYRKDGRPFWNELRIQPLFDEGRVVNFVGLMHDVTSNVEAEQNNRTLVFDLGERVKEMTGLHAVARILQETETTSEKLLQKVVDQVPPAFQLPDRLAARLTLGSQEYSTPRFASSEYSIDSHAALSDGREVKLEVVYVPGRQMANIPFLNEERSLLQSVLEMLCSRWERDIARSGLQEAHVRLEERVAKRTLELEMRTGELRESEEHLRKINREILEISRRKLPPQTSLSQMLGTFTESAVRSMDVQRAGAWLFNESRSVLRCIDLFEEPTATHSQGLEFQAADFPLAFSPLDVERTMAFDDVAVDQRIATLYQNYLQPQGVGSMLIAPILKDGNMTGVLTLARLGTPRAWTLEDQTYAGSLADLIALDMETLELQKVQESLRVATLEAEQARRSAEEANLAKSEFLSRMSHELRTPLNSILGFGQLLENDQLSEKQKERAGLIVTAGRHLLSLINEVLDIARVESGHLSLSIEPVQLESVIEEALSLIVPLASSHNISLLNETRNDAEFQTVFALADRRKLHQVMLNLLSNAVKYNKENGFVRVSCEARGLDHIRLSVANTGHGIKPENLERAFIPFERLNAEQSGIEGTGLGLVLVKRLVEAMHGTVEVRSTPDAETAFTITLPVTHDPLQAPRAPQDGVCQLVPQNQFRVLYIEDNLTNIKLIESIFSEMKNVQLMTAMQGRIGLELAREHCPDLILLDLHLPDIDGIEVLQNLKIEKQTRTIPVVVVSADATLSQQKKLQEQGAHHYLTKPLDINLFLSTINEIVENIKLTELR